MLMYYTRVQISVGDSRKGDGDYLRISVKGLQEVTFELNFEGRKREKNFQGVLAKKTNKTNYRWNI